MSADALKNMRLGLCGPIAEPGKPARGGYESANLRMLDRLRAEGLFMEALAYPAVAGGRLALIWGYLRGFIGLVGKIITARPAYALVHFTPHFRPFLYAEWLIAAAVWVRGGKLCLDVRAGSVPYFYGRGSGLYQWLFRSLLRRAEIVTCEGARDAPWLARLGAAHPWRLPNWVCELPAGLESDLRAGAVPVLAYCGRLVPTKGLEVLIEVLRRLKEEGRTVRGLIIGDGPVDYVQDLKRQAKDLDIHWTGALAPPDVAAALAKAHFFVFATSFYGEGQSNALTEAMAAGLAPIVSDHGFSADVAGATGAVLPAGAPAADYAAAIAAILDAGAWAERSRAARNRIAAEFSAAAVIPMLMNAYADALAGKKGRD